MARARKLQSSGQEEQMHTRVIVLGAGFVLAFAGYAHARCSSYGGPPPPPPPNDIGGPTTGGGETGGPTTGGGSPTGGPTTGGGGAGGPTTGGGGGGGPTTGDPRGGRPSGAGGGIDRGHWSHWWYANRLFLLRDGLRARTHAAAKTEKANGSGFEDTLWRADARRALAVALSDDDDEVVAAAVLALGKAGNASDIPLVAKLVADTKRGDASRESGAMALGLLHTEKPEDGKTARDTLRAVIAEKRANVRLRGIAVYALGMMEDDHSVPFLTETAVGAERTWDVPAAALTALGLSGSELARGDLEKTLQSSSKGNNSVRRVYAAHGLAKLGDPAALPVLLETLRDGDFEVRRAVTLAIGAVAPEGDRDAVVALGRTLENDDDRGARGMAAIALALVGDDAALAMVRRSYGKAGAGVRPYTAMALGILARRLQRPEIVRPLLRDIKRGARKNLKGASCVAIGLAGLREGAPQMREIASSVGDPHVRAQAAVSLALLGDRDEGPQILRDILSESNDPMLRGEAALGLGMLGDMRTLGVLEGMAANGTTESERITALVALGRIGGKESANILVKVLGDEKSSGLERHIAANAIGNLLDESEGRRIREITADLDWYVLTDAAFQIRTEM
jgi:HEAT repeat protein